MDISKEEEKETSNGKRTIRMITPLTLHCGWCWDQVLHICNQPFSLGHFPAAWLKFQSWRGSDAWSNATITVSLNNHTKEVHCFLFIGHKHWHVYHPTKLTTAVDSSSINAVRPLQVVIHNDAPLAIAMAIAELDSLSLNSFVAEIKQTDTKLCLHTWLCSEMLYRLITSSC
jgi:hypothetical protein